MNVPATEAVVLNPIGNTSGGFQNSSLNGGKAEFPCFLQPETSRYRVVRGETVYRLPSLYGGL